jgi:hypothetical protein
MAELLKPQALNPLFWTIWSHVIKWFLKMISSSVHCINLITRCDFVRQSLILCRRTLTKQHILQHKKCTCTQSFTPWCRGYCSLHSEFQGDNGLCFTQTQLILWIMHSDTASGPATFSTVLLHAHWLYSKGSNSSSDQTWEKLWQLPFQQSEILMCVIQHWYKRPVRRHSTKLLFTGHACQHFITQFISF